MIFLDNFGPELKDKFIATCSFSGAVTSRLQRRGRGPCRESPMEWYPGWGSKNRYLKGFAPMPPAPLVWKYGYEVAKWRVVSENCGCQVAKWRCVSEPKASQRRPEARPGGSGVSEIAPRRLPGGSKIAPCRLQRLKIAGGQKRCKMIGLQRGVLSLRTSEFWRPVLGDLEAKNLDSLEDYTLVATSSRLNSLVAPQGGRRIAYFLM